VGFAQSGFKPLGPHRFHQVIHRVYFKGLAGISVIGGGEDNRGRVVQFLQVLGDLDPIHARHPDIQQQRVHGQLL
jgi:hypothetical protein